MKRYALGSGILSGPMPEPGETLDLRPVWPKAGLETENTDQVIGAAGQSDLNMLARMSQLLGKPLHEMPRTYAQSQIYADTHSRQEPTVNPGVTPEMRTALDELSGITQGQRFSRPSSDKDPWATPYAPPQEDDTAGLPDLPTGPPSNSAIADEMKGPLQQLNFMDPRYRNGGWF